MGLRKKTFLYSVVLALIMIVFVIGYFVLMLPSLYVDYVLNSNLESAVEIQKGYMEERSYDNLTVKNPSSVYTLEIPNTGDEVYLAGKFFKATVVVRNEELLDFLNQIRSGMGGAESSDWLQAMSGLKDPSGAEGSGENVSDSGNLDGEDFTQFIVLWQDKFKEIFAGHNLISENFPIEIKMEPKGGEQVYKGEYSKLHTVSGDIIVYEGGVSDGSYSYTTYVAMGRTQDALIITVLPTMTPQMEEIRPIVMGSLPMIVAVIFLVVLVSSGFFAGRIVNPIIRLANHAESAGIAGHFETDEFTFVSDRKDEIGTLERNLQELYTRLRDSYDDLACKNHMLEEENERREVFLRASSHQLKTPIAAALLLVEGMLNEVGKYKDTKTYLPEVKQQLLSMRKIVEDILYLNYHAKDMQQEDVAVEVLAQELVRAYAVQAEDKKLQVIIDGKGIVQTDREMLKKIADNLLSNAVQYTPEQQKIVIEIDDMKLCMTNYGVTIDEELLPNVFEPFVSSDGSRKGRGLGLYVAAYYSKLAGYKLKIENIENGVRAELYFEKVMAQ